MSTGQDMPTTGVKRDQVVWRDRWERHDNGNHYGWRNQDKHGGNDRGRGHGKGKWKDRD